MGETNHKFINQFDCQYDGNHRNAMMIQSKNQHLIRSMYIPNREHFPEHRKSVNSLKDELEEVRNQVRRINREKPELESKLRN